VSGVERCSGSIGSYPCGQESQPLPYSSGNCRSASGSLPSVQALPHHRGSGDQHRLRPAMSHSRQNNTRPDSRARLFRDRRSLSVPGLRLAGLSDDEAELRNDLGDGGLGGLKGNNLARTRSRNKQFGFA
jgi:hypothetical protein